MNAIVWAPILAIGATAVMAATSLEQSVAQSAAAASRLLTIARICPSLIPTDAEQARKFVEAYATGGRRLAKNRWDKLARAEVAQRLAEVEVVGEQRWCEDQRRYLREIGALGIFPQGR